MSVIDGSEMVDYTRAPNFGVGSWVTYHAVSNSALGYHSDYFITLLIAGEEEFWGERCFWLETWTKDAGADTFYTASLISYSAFGDTAAVNHIGWFVRKTIQHLGADGEPEQMLNKRDATEFKLRAKDRNKRVEEGKETEKLIDTLGVDTVAVPRGRFRGPVVREINRLVENAFRGDSTIYYIRQETRTRKLAEAMPILSNKDCRRLLLLLIFWYSPILRLESSERVSHSEMLLFRESIFSEMVARWLVSCSRL